MQQLAATAERVEQQDHQLGLGRRPQVHDKRQKRGERRDVIDARARQVQPSEVDVCKGAAEVLIALITDPNPKLEFLNKSRWRYVRYVRYA